MSALNIRPNLICCLAALSITIPFSSCSKEKEEKPMEEKVITEKPRQRRSVPLRPEPYSIKHWPVSRAESSAPWEKKYLEADTDAERIEIVSEKATNGPEFLAPLLRRALRSESLELNAQAIDSAYLLSGVDAIDVLSGAACHSSEEIAILATEAAREQPLETRMKIYENTLASPHESVREIAVIDLSRENSKPAIDLLISGLLDPSKSINDTTNQALQRRFNRTFDSAPAAMQWWNQNHHKYSDSLKNVVAP